MSQQDSEEVLRLYWNRRIKEPLIFTLIINITDFASSFSAVLSPKSDRHQAMNLGYTINSIIIFTILITALFNSNWLPRVRYAFWQFAMRNIIRIFDFEETQETMLASQWAMKTNLQIVIITTVINMHFTCFNPELPGYNAFGVVYSFLMILALLNCRVELTEIFDTNDMLFKFIYIPAVLMIVILTLILQKYKAVNMEFVRLIVQNLEKQQVFSMVLMRFEESLLISSTEGKVALSNQSFASMFAEEIAEAKARTLSIHRESERALSNRDQGVYMQIYHRASDYWQRLRKCCLRLRRRRKDVGTGDLWDAEDAKDSSQELNDIDFLSLKLFKRYRSPKPISSPNKDQESNITLSAREDVEEKLGFRDLLDIPTCELEATTFVVDKKAGCRSLPEEFPTAETESDHKMYIRFSLTRFEHNLEPMVMFQILDVTSEVLYDKSREQNELLSLINATVSHEMRNPLNSIMAQNTQKQALYSQLEEAVKNVADGALVEKSAKIFTQLRDGMKVQNSSASLMSFLVQDLLDYAQIKSGNFRKMIKQFDIRETVEKVMSIQRSKAEQQQIKLFCSFPNFRQISDNEQGQSQFLAVDMHSPLIYTDEQRVMQVLLNLQSNALKFTKPGGSVEVISQIISNNNKKFLQLTVADSGVGIPLEQQNKLFKLFGFVKDTQAMNTSGIGLGLCISEQIIKKFGGKIQFRSVPEPEEGHGTTFTFTFRLSEAKDAVLDSNAAQQNYYDVNQKGLVYDWLPPEASFIQSAFHSSRLDHGLRSFSNSVANEDYPLQDPTQERVAQIPRSFPPINEVSLNSIRMDPAQVLIVDDQVFNVEALRVILQYRLQVDSCSSAFSGQEALDIIRDDFYKHGRPSFKLILMDCNMPFMDGYTCADIIRTFYYQEAGLAPKEQPVISAVTGQFEPQYIRRCFKSGMNQVMSKPVELDCLRYVAQASGLI